MKRYDVFWADVPCDDGSGEKTRPALVVAVVDDGAKFLEITSQGKTPDLQYRIENWAGANLPKESYISYDSLIFLKEEKIKDKIGHLDLIDIVHIEPYILYGIKYKK